MQHLKQSIAWWCFAPTLLAPQALIRAAAEIGYAAVELVPAEYWPLVRDHGLSIAAITGHQSITAGLNRREHHAQIERELMTALSHAERFRIPNLICFSGNRYGTPDRVGAEITAEGLRRVARAAEDAGVTLVLELLNSKVDHPGYQGDHTAWGVTVCQLVDSPRVKLLYDIYHMQIMEGDIIRTIQSQHAYFGHYHMAGNPGRHEPDDQQELSYPAIVRAIAATGYTGYLAQEFIPCGEPIGALKTAFDLCTSG